MSKSKKLVTQWAIEYLMCNIESMLRIEAGVLGPVKKVYKVPQPARTPLTAPPIRVPEEAPKEPVKVG